MNTKTKNPQKIIVDLALLAIITTALIGTMMVEPASAANNTIPTDGDPGDVSELEQAGSNFMAFLSDFVLRIGGGIALLLGIAMYALSSNNSQRTQQGKHFIVAGIGALGVSFLWSSIASLIASWFTTGAFINFATLATHYGTQLTTLAPF